MIVIEDVIISDEIVQEHFMCNLSACKGACCVEGDYGAPVSLEEMETISKYKEKISEYLPQVSQEYLAHNSGFTFYKQPKVWGTSCHEDGSCVFLTKNEQGISMCGIEQSWQEGKIPFRKPISCHLYPIRISENQISGFEAWNYDRWEICSAACSNGEKHKMPLYKFAKEAIIRHKGEEFYNQLKGAASL